MAVSALKAVPAGMRFDTVSPPPKTVAVFNHLGEDSTPLTILPLVTIHHPITDPFAVTPEGSSGRITSVQLHLFDRSVGIVEVEVDLEPTTDNGSWMRHIDAWSHSLVQRLLSEAQGVVSAIGTALTHATLPDGRKIARATNEESAYFDVAATKGTHGPMWISRVLCLPASAFMDAAVSEWTHGQYVDQTPVAVGSGNGYFGIGNSVLGGNIDADTRKSVLRGLLLANELYAVVHILTHNQKSLFHALAEEGETGFLQRIRTRKPDNALRATHTTATIRKTLDALEQEYEDALVGLQGVRRVVLSAYLQHWRFDLLMETCRKRVGSAQALIDDATAQRTRRYTSVVEAALVLIGSLTVVDFTLNLLTFSDTIASLDDGYPGLVDMARGAPPDLILNVLLGFLVLLAVERLRR